MLAIVSRILALVLVLSSRSSVCLGNINATRKRFSVCPFLTVSNRILGGGDRISAYVNHQFYCMADEKRFRQSSKWKRIVNPFPELLREEPEQTRSTMSKQLAEKPDTGCCTEEIQGQKTVLIIDDDEPVIIVLREGLADVGYRVLPALSGQSGLELFKNNHVDVILCDLSMPHMDGWMVAEKIRQICERRRITKPPFLFVTAWADQVRGDNRIRELGVDTVLGKPINFYDLIQAIDRAAKRHGE